MNLKQFDEPKIKPSSGGFVNKLEAVPDGEYEVEVVNHESKDVKDGAVLSANLITTKGLEFPKEWFIISNDKMAQFLGDLKKMGFDVDNWTVENNRPRSEEIDKALKCMKGMRFKVVKKSEVSKKDQKTYHNLYVNERLADGKPNPVPVEYLNEVGGDPFA